MSATKFLNGFYIAWINMATARAARHHKKFGKDKLLEVLEAAGYPCELEILSDQKDKNQYPKDGTYIVTLKNRQTLFESM